MRHYLLQSALVDRNNMSEFAILNREASGKAASTSPGNARPAGGDKAMLKAAADLTRDLNAPSAAIYWSDLIGSAVLGYGSLALAMSANSTPIALLAALVAVLALYRAGSFIHELTHLKPGAVPGFRLAWNVLIGVPLLVPSFLYEGVHNQHHAKTYYGTANDPEYPGSILNDICAAARRGGRPLFGAADQSALPPAEAAGQIRPRLGMAGGGCQPVGDRADCHGGDRHHSASGFPDRAWRRVGRHVLEPGPHARRPSVGK
jgi:hypothetical protein